MSNREPMRRASGVTVVVPALPDGRDAIDWMVTAAAVADAQEAFASAAPGTSATTDARSDAMTEAGLAE